MRQLTDHIVSGDQAVQLQISVIDEPGAGGACHQYSIGDKALRLCEINFQNGPIKEKGVNGVTQEALLAIVIDRLRGFQAGQYACQDNEEALRFVEYALFSLQRRTQARIQKGIEGTSIVDAAPTTTQIANSIADTAVKLNDILGGGN